MARQAYEEAIRLYLETSGDEQLRALIDQMGDVGDTADFQSTIARKAFDRLADSIEAAGKVDAFVKLKQDLVETEAQLERAQTGAQDLFKTFKAGDDSNSGISRMQAQARKTVNDLSASVEKQRTTLQQLRGELARSGVDTRSLGTAQGDLKAKMATARDALAQSVKSLQAFRAEQAKAGAEIPASNERIAKSYGSIRGALAGLRSLAAPVLAFLTFQGAKAGIQNLLGVAAGAEDARRALMEMYGSQEAGNRAYDELQKLAKKNGLAFDSTLESAKKLKAFGLDPLGGSLQALIDQNAAAGGSQEDLSGKVLALGQAWAKQKLQGEEILQLVERGVPVWDLLTKSTGKNTDELQKLSEAGKLGRDVIADLIDEIGRANAGAAERGLSSLTGLIAQVSARWVEFRQKIVDAGVGEYFEKQIQVLLNSSGGLDGLAQKIGSAIISTAEGLKSFGASLAPFVSLVGNVTFGLARNAEALVVLAKAYAGVKIVDFYQSMAKGLLTLQANAIAMQASSVAATQVTGSFGKLRGVINGLPSTIKIGVAALGIDFVIGQLTEILRLREEGKRLESETAVIEAGMASTASERVRQGQEMQRIYARYADVVIQSNAQIKNQSLEQAEAYKAQLQGAQNYFTGIIKSAVNSGQAVDANVTESIRRVNAALELTNIQIAATAEALRLASTQFTGFSTKAVEKFDELVNKGKTVKESVSKIFDGVDFTRTEGIKNAVGILDQMSARGTDAATAIREELRAQLVELADTDLPKLKLAAEATFGAGSIGAKTLAEEVGKISLTRLGVDIDAIKTGYTKAGRAAVDAFKDANVEVSKLALATGERSQAIAQAFNSAFRAASTSTELKALKAALIDAMAGGNLNSTEFQNAVAQVEAKLANLAAAGAAVGDGVRSGAQTGASALSGLANAASTATDDVSAAGSASEETGGKAKEAAKETKSFSFSMGELSEAAQDALDHLNQFKGGNFVERFADVWNEIYRQRQELAKLGTDLSKAAKAFDEFAERREELRKTFTLLTDSELDSVIQQEKQIERSKQAQRDKQAQANEEQRRADLARLDVINASKEATENASRSATPGEQTLVIDWRAPSKSVATSATVRELEEADRIATLVAPRVLAIVKRSRDGSGVRYIR